MEPTPEMIEMRKAGMSFAAIAKKIGKPKSTVQVALARAAQPSAPKPTAKAAPADRTLADFRREHDQTWKIRDGLKRLFNHQNYKTDAEFREAVNGNPARWRAAADQAEFRSYRYRVSGDLLWASAATIKEMRKIRGEVV